MALMASPSSRPTAMCIEQTRSWAPSKGTSPLQIAESLSLKAVNPSTLDPSLVSLQTPQGPTFPIASRYPVPTCLPLHKHTALPGPGLSITLRSISSHPSQIRSSITHPSLQPLPPSQACFGLACLCKSYLARCCVGHPRSLRSHSATLELLRPSSRLLVNLDRRP